MEIFDSLCIFIFTSPPVSYALQTTVNFS